jgi:MFS family permease
VTASDGSAAREAPFVPTYRLGWFTVCMTTLVAIMSQIDRGILALFVQPMKRDFGLSDTQVSLLLGTAFTLAYVVGGPPLSRIADNGVRKTVISGCLAVWSVATACCGISQSFWAFFFARAVIGGTESGCGPASLSMIADAVPHKRMPMAYALYNSGFLGGQALSMIIGGVLIGLLAGVGPIRIAGIGTIFNWQLVFILLGAIGLVIALLFAITVPEPPRRGSTRKEGYPLREVIGFIISQRAFHLRFLCAALLATFQVYGLLAWMPAFYERTYGWGPATIGPLLGIFTLVASTIGLFAGARLAEILGRKYEDANMRVYFIAFTCGLPFGVIAPLMPNPWLALTFYAMSQACGAMGSPVFSAALQVASPNEMRSQVTALYFVVANAIAGSLGPTIIALLTDYVAHSENDLRYVLCGYRIVLGPIASIVMWKTIAPYRRLYRERMAAGQVG